MHKGISDKGLSRIARSMNFVPPKAIRKAKEVNAARPDESTDEVQEVISATGTEAIKDGIEAFAEIVGNDPERLKAIWEQIVGGMNQQEKDQVEAYINAKWGGEGDKMARRQAAPLNEEMASLESIADNIGWAEVTERILKALVENYSGNDNVMGPLAEMALQAVPEDVAKYVVDRVKEDFQA